MSQDEYESKQAEMMERAKLIDGVCRRPEMRQVLYRPLSDVRDNDFMRDKKNGLFYCRHGKVSVCVCVSYFFKCFSFNAPYTIAGQQAIPSPTIDKHILLLQILL